AGAPVAPEILQRLSIAGERRRAMRDRRAGPGENAKVLARVPMQPRVFVDEDRMAQDRARSQDADGAGPLDRSLAVPLHHHVELVDALRAMRGEGKVPLS